ncbi:MAG: hypothetical protein M1343_06875, partial [Chloroflexi bacterium]|nr:hypothetical protein [Chloroflexota bacterium]
QLDVELVCSRTGRNLGRPWATFLTDAFSRRFLAVYLTFDPPSVSLAQPEPESFAGSKIDHLS